MEELEVHSIHPPKFSLRSDLGQLDELISSIEEKGLLEPIVVRPVEDGFEVVAGHRRLEACKRLGWRKIPCHIIELDDREAYEVSLIVYNSFSEKTHFQRQPTLLHSASPT
jgi:ParB family chromosome partitioning protein